MDSNLSQRKTDPPPRIMPYDPERDQRELTAALLEHGDPHVRLIAHMSNRQLGMVESISSLAGLLGGLTNEVALLRVQVEQLTSQGIHKLQAARSTAE